MNSYIQMKTYESIYIKSTISFLALGYPLYQEVEPAVSDDIILLIFVKKLVKVHKNPWHSCENKCEIGAKSTWLHWEEIKSFYLTDFLLFVIHKIM